MKKIITILATATFSCCGLSSLFAQIPFESQGQLRPQRSTLVKQSLLGDLPAQPSSTNPPEAIANPFDFLPPLDDQDPFALPSTPKAGSDNPGSAPRASDGQIADAPVDVADPSSLPVGRQHAGRTIVETVIDHATVASVPHAGLEPVMWCETVGPPNPVAELLLRDLCNARALWANYPAQHAAECAHMWASINKHAECGNCGQCGNSAGGNTAGSSGHAGCARCRAPAFNRYTGRTSTRACDTCDSVPNVVPPAAVEVQPEAASAQRVAPSKQSNVAFLPIPTIR